MRSTTDVAVVGGGLAGLAAAATAARTGRRVVLFDAGALGGRARSAVRDGFTFNTGPHALYAGGDADRVLADLGIAPAGSPAPGTGVVARRGALHTLPGAPGALLRTSLLSPREKVRFARMLAGLGRVRAAGLADRTVDEWLTANGATGDLRDLLLALVRLATYAEAPHLLSADAAVSQLQLAARNPVRYLDGGWAQLVAALTDRAVAAGVEVRPGERVLGVVGTAAGPVAETGSGSLLAGSVVIAAGTPAGAAALLGETPAAWAELGPATTMSCLDLGLRRVPDHRFALGLDDTTYFSVHSPPARLAPEGGAVVQIGHYHAVGADPFPAADERRLLEGVARRHGIREDDVVTDRYLHRMVTSGGFPTARHGGLAGRPGVAVPGHDRVFVAGDWVGPAGLLADAALASGARAGALAATTGAPVPEATAP